MTTMSNVKVKTDLVLQGRRMVPIFTVVLKIGDSYRTGTCQDERDIPRLVKRLRAGL